MDVKLKTFSHRVKKIRLEHGVSQTEMAKAIGTSQTNLSNMEAGRTAITLQNLFKIQSVLGCKLKEFFVDFDGEEYQPIESKDVAPKNSIDLEDAVNILKLLKAVDVKGL